MRIVLSIFSAVVVAFGLLLFMASLISIAEINGKPTPINAPDVVQVDPPEKEPVKPAKSTLPRPSLTLALGPGKLDVPVKTSLTRPGPGEITPHDIPKFDGFPHSLDPTWSNPPGENSASRGLRPVAQMPPQYPETARHQEVEGFVTLAFVVQGNGQVADIQVIAAQPRGMFEKAARQALMRWRYAAHDEAPIPQTVTLDFRFD